MAVSPWKAYAAETGAAVLLVAHTNRAESQDIRNTYGLSGALRQVARGTMYALEDPNSKELLVGPEKSNLGGKGLAYRFTRVPVQHFQKSVDSDGTVARLEAVGESNATIQDILAAQVQAAKPEPQSAAIDQWLKGVLAEGPLASKDLVELGELEGYSPDKIRRAGERIGVTRNKSGNGGWTVSLAADT